MYTLSKSKIFGSISVLIASLLAVGLLGAVFYKDSRHSVRLSPFVLKKIEPEYAADFSNDKILIGAAHNVFVGKVIRESGNKERGIGAETQFQVHVLENIKGNLSGTVTVDQQGGYKDGALYVVTEDMALVPKQGGDYLLQPGSTYLLTTRYNREQDWYTLNSYPTARKLLSDDPNMSEERAKTAVDSDSRVQELKAAYPNEILLDADVKHNNARNSYVSAKGLDVTEAQEPASNNKSSN